MKIHTTNYQNALIAIAEDCPVDAGQIPPVKENQRTIANIQFDLLHEHPYEYTSDDVVFACYAEKNGLKKNELKAAREQFFCKGQACLRTSPLAKRYGWGIHHDADGKVALVSCDSAQYKKLAKDKSLDVVKAMRTSRS